MNLVLLKVTLGGTELALRSLCAWLCQLIYPLIAKFFQLFITVARLDFLSSDYIQPIYQRITMILSIVMVFYVTFEVVKYVIDPDQVTDKEKGAGKIAYRMIAVIVLIAFVPNIFSWAYKVQNVIIENQIIPKIVLGKTNINYESFGNNFSTQMFSTFYSVDEDYRTEDCDGIACGNVVNANLSSLQKYGELPYINVGINQAIEVESTIEGEDVVQPVIQFDALLSVIVGSFMLYVLLLYSIDLGVRFAQMIFLQIIAPIPIMGYLIPKKDGIFEKWTKQCITTYLDLFIRLLVIFFVLAICEQLGDAFASKTLFNGIEVSDNLQKFVYIILIMGLLLFIRKVPKLMEDLFPKMGNASGNFGLKASERIAPEAARAIGATLGASRLIGGAISRGVNTARRNKAERERTGLTRKEQKKQHKRDKDELKSANKQYKNALRNRNRMNRNRGASSPDDRENAQKEFEERRRDLVAARSKVADDKNKKYRSVALSALSGGVSGAARGIKAGLGAKKTEEIFKKVGEGYKADNNAIKAREKWLDSGGGSEAERIISSIQQKAGIVTQAELMEREIKRVDGEIKANETKINRTSVPKESVGKAEDAGKDKATELKADATIGKSYGGIVAEAGDTLGTVARKGREKADRLSNEAKALNDAKVRTEQELRTAQSSITTETDPDKQTQLTNMIQQKQEELKKINQELDAKSLEATNARENIKNVDKAVAREEITKILQKERDPEKVEAKVVAAVDTALKNVELSKNDATVVAEMKNLLDDDTYAKYMSGNIKEFDELDAITNALKTISNKTSDENLAKKDLKQRLEASDAYAAAKANNEASGKK